MTTNFYTLQLEPYDDVVSVRDRLTFLEARRVLLVWPPDAPGLRRKLDLLLIQREASRHTMHIALVTQDSVVIDHARDLNISVFPNKQTARSSRWQRPRDKVFTAPHNPTTQTTLTEQIIQRRQPLSPATHRRKNVLRRTVFIGLLLILALGFFLIVPSATVTLTPASHQVFETVSIVADPALTDIDIENYRMPATVITLQASGHVTIQTSGQETLASSLAEGFVTFSNLSDSPILIPHGTIVTTSGIYLIRFETVEEAILPAGNAAQIQLSIQALPEHAGASGNVDPGTINRVEGGFSDQVTVTNLNATYGGAIQKRSVVTAEDHARLLVLGRQQVLQNARDELLLSFSGEQFVVPGSASIIRERPEWTIYSAIVGDTTASVELDLRAEVQAVVIDTYQAQQVAFAALAPHIQPGLEILPDALSFSRGDIVQIEVDGRVTFLIIVKGDIAVSIDADQVRDRVRGVSVDEAYHRLEHEWLFDPNHPPRIVRRPNWYPRMPELPLNIKVIIATP